MRGTIQVNKRRKSSRLGLCMSVGHIIQRRTRALVLLGALLLWVSGSLVQHDREIPSLWINNGIVQEDGSNHNYLNSNATTTRMAYLITTNPTSPRTLRSQRVLHACGFQVQYQMASLFKNKVLSNQRAQIDIYQQVAKQRQHNPDSFAYIFEDDIVNLTQFHVTSDLLVKAEQEASKDAGFLYLGLCRKKEQQRQQQQVNTSKFCGRCAHAYGINPHGAQRLLDYIENHPPAGRGDPHVTPPALLDYMDVVLEQWCQTEVQGVPLVGNTIRYDPKMNHYGVFAQDRQAFPSMISGKKKKWRKRLYCWVQNSLGYIKTC